MQQFLMSFNLSGPHRAECSRTFTNIVKQGAANRRVRINRHHNKISREKNGEHTNDRQDDCTFQQMHALDSGTSATQHQPILEFDHVRTAVR